MADILAVRHVDFEHLGTLEPLLAARGHTVRYVDAGTGPIDAAMADEPGLIAMLGGPIGAYEESLYPFLRDELALIERRLKNGGPLLGKPLPSPGWRHAITGSCTGMAIFSTCRTGRTALRQPPRRPTRPSASGHRFWACSFMSKSCPGRSSAG